MRYRGRDSAQAVTQGQRVLPRVLAASGFRFEYENIRNAIRAILVQ